MNASRRNRLLLPSLWLIFFINGAVLSSWAPRIPEVKTQLNLSDADIGIALLGVALGSVPTMLISARLMRRFSDKAVCVVTAVAFPAALPLISYASDLITLTLALVILGAASGGLDVSMNALGVRLEPLLSKRIMGRLQGAYSLGVLAGTGGAAVAIHISTTVAGHFWFATIIMVIVATLSSFVVGSDRSVAVKSNAEADLVEKASSPSKRVLVLTTTVAVVAISGFLVEGLVNDWSALYMQRDMGASPVMAAAILTAFSLAMFVSRSMSDALLHRVRESTLLVCSAVLIILTILIATVFQTPAITFICITIIGVGVGPLFPLALSIGARKVPRNVPAMTAQLSVVGYTAYLLGPPMIGFASEHWGLTTTFAAVVMGAGMAILVSGIKSRTRQDMSKTLTQRSLDGVSQRD